MTEASTVARAAEHLELEIMHSAGAAGSHNHAHFQVGVGVGGLRAKAGCRLAS